LFPEQLINTLNIITLTTDFGNRDFYAGALKGALLNQCPNVTLADISHEIEPYNIVHAAFVARNTWSEFPEGTIHLIAVNCVYSSVFRFILARHAGHYFLAPDNGILTLLFEEPLQPHDLRLLAPLSTEHFPVKNIFAAAVSKIIAGHPFETIGDFAPPLLQRIGIRPVIMPNRIRGTVIHIDNFGNIIVNIRQETLDQVAGGRPFALYFKRHDPITRLSTNYCDVPVGEQLCLFNSAGYLEIAINMDRADVLLGLKLEDIIEIVFEEK
jgi:S-adenosylmethionine hydrolase